MVFYRLIDCLKVAYSLGIEKAEECVVEIANGTLRSIAGESILQ